MVTEFQPYVGPRPYKRDDPAPFFGRDHEADELVSLIISSWEVLFYAQSGAGKTSLLNAGVIPQLEEEGFEVLPLARVQGVIPEGIQSEEIQNIYVFNTFMSWAKEEINPKRFVQMSLTEYLKERKHRTDNDGQPLPRALIFDQFEELFTLYQDRWNDRNEFFKQVRDALKDENRLLRVIFTMREDYIAQLDPYAHLLPEKMRTRFRMERLRRDAALSAITGPLRETKRSFAKGVADKLVEDLLTTQVETITGETIEVIGEFVEPVQLQVVCQNLWQELPSNVSEITKKHLVAFGGIDRPLSRFYEAAVKAAAVQTGIDEEKLRQWCEKWLITSTGTRNIVHRGPQQTEGIPNTALDILADRHLINLEWRAGARWYELTHDRFIKPIQASNERWNKQREEKVNQASLMIRQAEQNIMMKIYERALDTSRRAYALSEEIGDRQGEAIALFYLGKAYEGQKLYDEALTNYASALELVKQTHARDIEANLLIAQGSLFEQSKKYEQALQCFTSYIDLMQDDSLGYSKRGYTYYNLKQYDRAIDDYNRVLELNPNDVDANNNRGRAYYNLKQYERAIKDYNRTLELDPEYAYAYYNRGLAYRSLKQNERAIADYDRALELDPKYVKAYNSRGLAYRSLKQYERATEDFNCVLELDPEDVKAYYNRGNSYFDLKQYEQAVEDFNCVLELDPEDVKAYYSRGLAYYNLKQYERATEDFNHVVELDPKYVKAYNSRGLAYQSLKQYEQAVENFNCVLELDPEYAYAYHSRGLAYYNLKQYERATEDFNHVLELDPKYVYAYGNRGLAYYNLKQYEHAIEDFNHVLELNSKDVKAYYSRGLAYYNLKQYERAIEDFNRVLELNSKDVKAYYNRGLAYASLKQYEHAIEDFNRVLELDPQYVKAYYSRGLAYASLKQYERAIEDYEYSIELDPEDSVAYLQRGYTYLSLRDIKQAQIDFMRSWQIDSTNVNYGLMTEWATTCQEKPGLQTAERLEAIAANAPNVVESYICRGVALWIRGSFEEATAELNRAIPLNPELEDIYFWKGMVLAYLGQDDDAIAAIEKSLELNLPPLLLSPLRWLEQDRPDFYRKYTASLLARFEI